MTANENKNREEPQNQNTTVKEAAKKLCRERRRSRLKSQGPRGRLDPDDFIHHPRHGQFGGQGEVVDEGNDRIPQIPCIHIQLLKHQNGQRQNFPTSNAPDNIFEQDLLASDIVYKTGKLDATNGTEAMLV